MKAGILAMGAGLAGGFHHQGNYWSRGLMEIFTKM